MGNILYSFVKLSIGTFYPAYCSFKAVKTRNIKEYVQWMTYWIVFSMVTMSEEVTDMVLSPWFPLYYEIKTLFLVWLVSPTTRGSVIIYTKIVHPMLVRNEEEIDEIVEKIKEQGYILVIRYYKTAAEKVSSTVIKTALAGGGGLMRSLRQSYSMFEIRDHSAGEIERRDMEMDSSDGWKGMEEDMRMRRNVPLRINGGNYLRENILESSHYATLPRSLTIKRQMRKTYLPSDTKQSKAIQKSDWSKNIKQYSTNARITTHGTRKYSLSRIEENQFENEESYCDTTRRTV